MARSPGSAARTAPASARRARTRLQDVADPAVRGLVELGLTIGEARAYVALLEAPLLSAADVATASGLARPKAYEALGLLAKRGFCEPVVGESVTLYRALAPGTALREWYGHREHERRALAERDERIVEELVARLPEPAAAAARDGELHDYFEAVEGRTRTNEALAALIGRAERTIAHMTQPPFVQPRAQWNVAETAALERGVEIRTVLTAEAATDPLRSQALLEAGAPVRVAPAIPMKLIMRDGVEAMVSLRNTATGEQSPNSIVIRHPDLVAPLLEMFDRVWDEAEPLPRPGGRRRAGARR
jgi:sugar-specific transcriptional regulator TrmB